MSLHKEIAFETGICETLAAGGWLYAEGDATAYDREHALFPADLIDWVKATQPAAWDDLVKSNGAAAVAEKTLLDRLRQQLDQRGTLDVLRHGFEVVGLRHPVVMAQFRPALAMNPDLQARYAANRLRVVRQVRYSVANENALDLVLFLNGVPVATAELKSDYTQRVEDAVDQYRFDRDPAPKGRVPERLLSFPNGALVHFAVSNSAVRMTTRLQGKDTVFLPFDQGHGTAAGNPPNPNGPPTAYLWEEVWARDSWLEIIGRYLVAERDAKKHIKKVIFPRYHQLAATRKLVAAVLAEGVGQRYLIQHSAGSGKTNSIAWTAHFLADLHDAANIKLFDTVLVVSDRTVLDSQLQEAIFAFERTTGVVATIKGTQGSKSAELAAALDGSKKVVVCTIQTFPFALSAVQNLAATQGKRFAVIADEAHSSQTGAAAAKLRQVLSAEEQAELSDGGEVGTEDILAAQMAARADTQGITFVAFTATPKGKTLELFGRRPQPDLPARDGNLPIAFHVYAMRQAIEEGFILDVLQNYTPYKLAFRLANEGKDFTEQDVERSAAVKGLMQWVRLHPYNIAQKVQVVVEHYRTVVAPLLAGQAKAMVVVGSRKEAVRWQLAIEAYIKSRGYKLRTLVAFSGEVLDPESGSDPFTETSKILNPTLNGRDIREAFATDEFHILLVANKFQTGFDQPLLCGMYVDKRLAGIQAVQTLSRLNRSHPGKDTTYILDFVNDPDEVLKSFRTYYETAELSGVTDPNLVLNLKAKLDGMGLYDENEVERVVWIELDPKATQAQLDAALYPVADRLLKRFKALVAQREAAASDGATDKAANEEIEALILFKADMATYLRVYAFLSQIIDYGSTAVEKRAVFFRRLLPLLDFGREREGVDLSRVKLTHHVLRDQGRRKLALADGEAERLEPLTEAGAGAVQDKVRTLRAEIISRINDLFAGDVTDEDKLLYVDGVIKGKLLQSEMLVEQAMNNSKQQFSNSPDLDQEILGAIMDALAAHSAMSKQALESENVRRGMRDVLLGPGRLWELLRARGEAQRAET